MSYKITARWHDITIRTLGGTFDIIEVNETLYSITESTHTNANLEEHWSKFPNDFIGSDVITIKAAGDQYAILHIIQNVDPDWIYENLKQQQEEESGICKCALSVVMNRGCPSNKGLKCPALQD